MIGGSQPNVTRTTTKEKFIMNTPNNNTSTTTTTQPANAGSPVITNVTPTKLSHEVAYQTLLQGILLRLSDVTTFVIQGNAMTRDEVEATLRGVISAAEDVKAKKNIWHAAIQAENQILAEATPLRVAVHALVISRYGKTSAVLREFGFAPAKVRKTPVASKVTAAEKSKATRTARNTMGKKQKKAVKGDVTGVVVTPVTSTPKAETPAATAPAATVTPVATSPQAAPTTAPR